MGTTAPKFVPSGARAIMGTRVSTSVPSNQSTTSLLDTFWNNLCSDYMGGASV